MVLFNFRKILKNIKNLIKNNFFFIFFNKKMKKKKYFKSNIFFFYLKNKKKININKNIVLLYLIKNIGNIHSCIRTNYLFNAVSIIKKKIKNKINSIYTNIFYIKSVFFFIFYFKQKFVLIALSTKTSICIKKIKLKKKFILLIGNEKFSINKKILKKIDIILKIKTYCKKSLNVNVVNGIFLFNFK